MKNFINWPLLFLISFFSFFSFSVFAKDNPLLYGDNLANTKLEKHFDLDKNGWVSLPERNVILTFQRYHYPWVKNKKQKKYDFNKNGMLEPHELQKYLAENLKQLDKDRISQ